MLIETHEHSFDSLSNGEARLGFTGCVRLFVAQIQTGPVIVPTFRDVRVENDAA